MDVYAFLFLPIAAALGLFIAFRRKKAEGVIYGPLDRVSMVLNAILVPTYGLYATVIMIVGMIIYPTSSATLLQQIAGVLISGIICAAPVYCAVFLGLSVALRRKGKRLAGFWIQFAGILGLLIPVAIFAVLDVTHISWLNTSLN